MSSWEMFGTHGTHNEASWWSLLTITCFHCTIWTLLNCGLQTC